MSRDNARPRAARRGAMRAVLLVLSLVAWLAPLAQATPQAEEPPPAEAARQILSHARYQTELPDGPLDDEPPFSLDLQRLLVVVGWTLAGLGLVVGLGLLVSRWRERRSREVEHAAQGGPARAGVTLSARPLEEAERLAREGRYGEAVRLLLQLTFEALREAGAVRLEPWRTGRAIARRAKLSSAGREALGELVHAVELAVFAGREPGGAEYERCAGRYRALLELAREGAA